MANIEAEEPTGGDIAANMSEEARARAEDELAHVEPGPSEPLHFGSRGQKTQLDEDPISEVNPFQESLP